MSDLSKAEMAEIVESVVRRHFLPVVEDLAARIVEERVLPALRTDAEAIARVHARSEAHSVVSSMLGKEFIITITEAQR